jgi:uncharacterized protein
MKYTPLATSLAAGILFGMGLALSGMTSPDKVRGFLDIFGHWDASLLFVMIGALAVSIFWHWFLSNRKTPFFAETWHFSWQKKGTIDAKLIGGSALFGVGWGLSGLCPGPAIGNSISFDPFVLVFLLGMTISMVLYKRFPITK